MKSSIQEVFTVIDYTRSSKYGFRTEADEKRIADQSTEIIAEVSLLLEGTLYEIFIDYLRSSLPKSKADRTIKAIRPSVTRLPDEATGDPVICYILHTSLISSKIFLQANVLGIFFETGYEINLRSQGLDQNAFAHALSVLEGMLKEHGWQRTQEVAKLPKSHAQLSMTRVPESDTKEVTQLDSQIAIDLTQDPGNLL